MQEVSRTLLLPPPTPPAQRASANAVQPDSESAIEIARRARRAQHSTDGAAHAFLTLVESQHKDTVEIRGKQFRFRPYSSRGTAAEAARDTERADDASQAGAISVESTDDDLAVDILDSFGSGARERNSSAFIASYIAQERLRAGLYNPQYESASDAY